MAKKLDQEFQVDKKIREYKLKNILTTVWMALYIIIIILEILALFKVISYLWGLGVFVLAFIIKLYLTKDSKKVNKKEGN